MSAIVREEKLKVRILFVIRESVIVQFNISKQKKADILMESKLLIAHKLNTLKPHNTI